MLSYRTAFLLDAKAATSSLSLENDTPTHGNSKRGYPIRYSSNATVTVSFPRALRLFPSPGLAEPPIEKSCLDLLVRHVGTTEVSSREHLLALIMALTRSYASANVARSINVNDPGLITLVNKLQDVFTTVGVCWHCIPLEPESSGTVLIDGMASLGT